MLQSLKLRQERGDTATEIAKMADLNNDVKHTWTGEDETRFNDISAQYDKQTEAITRAEKMEKVEADNVKVEAAEEIRAKTGVETSGAPTADERQTAMQAFLRNKAGLELSERHSAAAAKCGVNLNAQDIPLDLRNTSDYKKFKVQMRAPMSTSAGVGGETIPEGFVNNFEIAQLQFGGVRQVADVFRTATGNDLPWPTSDDTNNVGELLAENATAAELGITTSNVIFGAFKYSSKTIKISTELLEDSAFNMTSFAGTAAGERIGRITNQHFTTGTGSGQPNGIVTASALGVTAASATAITADEIINLMHSVDIAYRTGAGFMMNDSTVNALRLLKSADSQYIWQPGLQAGTPDTLLGSAIQVNNDMDAIATGNETILFGDLTKYKIRDVANIRVKVLTELFALQDQIAVVVFQRVDGDLLDAGTEPVKHLIQL